MKRLLPSLLLCCLALAGCRPAPATPWHSKVDHTFQRLPHAHALLDFADRPFPDPMSRETAFEILLKTEVLAGEFFDGTNSRSPQVRAFRRVLAEPDAASAFADLVRRGRMAGQLYGLSGLYLTDRAAFDREVERYRNSTESVRTFKGCILDEDPVADIVESKQSGSDIVGGALPKAFSGR